MLFYEIQRAKKLRLKLKVSAGVHLVDAVEVANAVSFSPPDGLIRLRLGQRDGVAEIAVEDEGPGLPEGQAERLFDRFYSKRPPGEAFGRHSGLGLSIARQIVEAHGGSIEAENWRDLDGAIGGARFVVRLPL